MKMAFNNPAGYLINRPSALAALLCLVLPALPVSAETIEAKLPSGISVSANFHTGRPSQPAVVLLHGFLQTHHSQPMNSLASNLSSKGFSTLSPTLSLGINQRNQSMPCEAVHTHTMAQDIAELDYWVNWLGNKGYQDIVLIGFSSTGNNGIILYNAQRAHPAISKTILISPNPSIHDKAERQKIRNMMETQPNTYAKKPMQLSLGYCKKNFTATAGSYLSYAQYDENKILELLRNTAVPTEIIFGSADTILPANWVALVKATNTKVSIIDKANHFFDGDHEFELVEEVEAALANLHAK